MKALTYVALDIPYCSLTYSNSPCTAGGNSPLDIPCLNTEFTCQDSVHFTESTVTLLFAIGVDYLPKDIEAIPCIEAVDYSPGVVGLDGTIGERNVLTVLLRDHKHPDTGPGFDKYYSERDYDPYEQGTIFGKLRARQPYLRGAAVRLYNGELGESLASMEIRNFIVESVNGPDEKGIFTITAKDVLKQLDGDRAQAPIMSTGYLSAEIDEDDQEITLLPTGIGDLEYPASGYMNIGGNEIVSFVRDVDVGNDSDTKLLLHFDGVDGGGANAGDYIDSSPSARTASRVGAVSLQSDQKKFGTTSMFVPADDGVTFPDSTDWNLNSDFTIDAWAYATSLASGRVFSHASSSTVGYRLLVAADGSVDFTLNNSSTLVQLTAAAATITADTWFHYAVERHGNVWTLFINGVVKDQDTVAPTVPDISAVFRVGIGSGGANGWVGYIDEFRFSKVARYNGTAFTPMTGPYQSSGDICYITRAQLGSVASTHQAEDRAQLVLIFSSQSPAAIIRTLEVDYAGVLDSYIPIDDWNTEVTTYLGQFYSAIIPEPTPVRDLVEELLKQAGLAHWWNDVTQQIELRVIRGVSLGSQTFSSSDRIPDSLFVKDQPEKQITRVQVYYGVVDPTKGIEDTYNFRGMVETVDEDAEANYRYQAITQIKSRWIPQFGAAIATKLAELLLTRYVAPPRKFGFTTMRSESIVPALGEGYQLSGWFLQDEFGAESPASFQVTRLKPGQALIELEGEEMLLEPEGPTDPNDHVLIISSNTNDFNLRTAHDATYAAAGADTVVTCIINSGVIVGASDPTQYAFDTGTWDDAGTEVIVEVRGSIQGAGGAGGRGTKVTSNSSSVTSVTLAAAGQAGGTALKVRRAISLDGSGTIKAGGGGGGGGGAFAVANATRYGGAGGGGAGRLGGPGALSWDSARFDDGEDGTSTAAGAGAAGSGGGDGGNGGAGGIHGSSGSAGTTVGSGVFDERDGGAGGAAGKAIEGNSFVTEIGTVTITGSRI